MTLNADNQLPVQFPKVNMMRIGFADKALPRLAQTEGPSKQVLASG
jgi:hypothetical protein